MWFTFLLGGLGRTRKAASGGATETLVFSTNFDSDADASTPAGFTELNNNNAAIKVSNPGSAGRYHCPYSSPADCRVNAAHNADHYAKAALSNFQAGNTGDECGVSLRLNTDVSPNVDGYRVMARQFGSGNRYTQLFKVVNDVETAIGSDLLTAWVDGDVLKAYAQGTGTVTISAFRNDVLLFQRTDSTSPHNTGNPGICANDGASIVYGDNFESGNLS